MENSRNMVPRFATAKQLAKIEPSFSLSSIRWAIFNADNNGFNTAIVRIGRKVLIDVEAFYVWIKTHRPSQQNSGVEND